VTPGKGGQSVDGIPVFDTVASAVKETGAMHRSYLSPCFSGDAAGCTEPARRRRSGMGSSPRE
jgi:succinyl-CoA synthetase alpha subunit